MTQGDSYRQLVAARAGGGCEYCRLLEAATGVTFHMEHVVPRSQGGATAMANLALACPGCNLAKADRTDIGEATIEALNMNDANRVFARKLQIQVGLIS